MPRRNSQQRIWPRRLELNLALCSMLIVLPMFGYVTWKMAGELSHGKAAEGKSILQPAEAVASLVSSVNALLNDQDKPGQTKANAVAEDQLQHSTESKQKDVWPPDNPACEFVKGVERKETITTRTLYDEIEFKNIDGGAWKQGWDVKYRGDEWDENKLRVFVVPHSHNDPGWIRTVEQYYDEKTRSILNTILTALKQDSRRKFIWEEMSYLSMWWEEAAQAKRDEFKWLVERGQLEIVGGGWVMNDEANAHYFAIIDQMMEGHQWILDHLGPAAAPKNAWQIDPFGHSPTMAYLNTRSGFNNMLIQRVHYEVKKKLAWDTNLEFLWRQTWDPKDSTDILTHMMPFYVYDVPHTCGPEPAVCCQFDFWRLPDSGSGITCPWFIPPEYITEHNVAAKAELILDQWRKKATLFKTSAVIAPLGDDFRYTNTKEAELQYGNYEALFEYINKHPELKAEVQWGTLEDYFQAVRQELQKKSPTTNSVVPPGSLPVLSGDFFTYADRMEDYWSGYYVSRPFFKAVDRVLEETLRRAEILYTLASATCPPNSLFAQKNHPLLVQARRNLAVFQHHDGVTGTAKDHVVVDYGVKMHTALTGLNELLTAAIPVLLSKEHMPAACSSSTEEDNLASWFKPEQVRSAHDILPEKVPIEVEKGSIRRVVVQNSLSEDVEQVLSVVVTVAGVCVLDANQQPVKAQLAPSWETPGRLRLLWRASLAPLSLTTFFISPAEDARCQQPVVSAVEVFNVPPGFRCPAPFVCTQPSGTEVSITNQRLTLTFDSVMGLLKHARLAASHTVALIDEELAYYEDQKGGAYLFLPVGDTQPLTVEGGPVFVTRGPFLQEVHSQFVSRFGGEGPVVRSARLYVGGTVQGSVAEMRYHVAIGGAAYNNKEVIVRYRTDVESGPVFHTDLNGFQMARRETYSKIPLQGNYYPMPSLAFIQDSTRRFSVHSRQAVGVASLKPGWLEMMLDRRLVQDDNRGLGQGVQDNHPNEVVFHLLLEPKVASGRELPQPWFPSLLSHRVTAQLAHPSHLFTVKAEAQGATNDHFQMSVGLLSAALPSDLFLLNLKTPRAPAKQNSSEPSSVLLLHRLAFDCSFGNGAPIGTKAPVSGPPVKTVDFGGKGAFAEGVEHGPAAVFGQSNRLDIESMFANTRAVKVRSTSLTILHDGATLEGGNRGHERQLLARPFRGSANSKLEGESLPLLEPMEVKAFKLDLERRTS